MIITYAMYQKEDPINAKLKITNNIYYSVI